MHADRDAIRRRDGVRVVEYAVILYPGEFVSYDGAIEALPARPSTRIEFQFRLTKILTSAMAPRG